MLKHYSWVHFFWLLNIYTTSLIVTNIHKFIRAYLRTWYAQKNWGVIRWKKKRSLFKMPSAVSVRVVFRSTVRDTASTYTTWGELPNEDPFFSCFQSRNKKKTQKNREIFINKTKWEKLLYLYVKTIDSFQVTSMIYREKYALGKDFITSKVCYTWGSRE